MFDTDPFSDPPGADQDPFSPSAREQAARKGYLPVWLVTRGGIEFLDVFVGENPATESGHMLVFLVHFQADGSDGSWAVGSCSSKTIEGGRWEHQDLDYATAKTLAENLANALSVDAGGNAGWRFAPPSPGQLNLIAKLGLDMNGVEKVGLETNGVETKGDASDRLNVHFGSKTLDPAFM